MDRCVIVEIGRVIENEVRMSGFHVIRQLCGHGVGRAVHEESQIPKGSSCREEFLP